jgi:hypothetical protein
MTERRNVGHNQRNATDASFDRQCAAATVNYCGSLQVATAILGPRGEGPEVSMKCFAAVPSAKIPSYRIADTSGSEGLALQERKLAISPVPYKNSGRAEKSRVLRFTARRRRHG